MARSELAQPRLTLDRYRELMHIPVCVFNGVSNPDEPAYGCDRIWTQAMRDEVAYALSDAESILSHHLKYKLGYVYETDYDHRYTNPIVLRWGHIVGGGVRARTAVTEGAEDFTTDPATITVAQSDFPGGTSEIVIVETSTGLEITPDSITASGTNYVISIGQCKLIEWDDLEFQRDPIDYDNTFPADTWLKMADLTIYRQYRDESDQATVVYGPRCSCLFGGVACAGTQYTGCVWVVDYEISEVKVQVAEYNADDEAWTYLSLYLTGCYEGDKCNVNYLAGTTSEPGYERAIRSLAHALMGFRPCGCAAVDRIWQRDSNIPERITAEQANCLFGQENGAWYAWNWAQAHMLGEAFLG